MSLIEILAGLVGLLGLAVAGLFQAWRGAKRREKDASAWAEAVTETLDHARRTQAAADAARKAGEKDVETVREQAREGRRDHFEQQ